MSTAIPIWASPETMMGASPSSQRAFKSGWSRSAIAVSLTTKSVKLGTVDAVRLRGLELATEADEIGRVRPWSTR